MPCVFVWISGTASSEHKSDGTVNNSFLGSFLYSLLPKVTFNLI